MILLFRQWRDNHLLLDTQVEDYSGETRTHKIFSGLEEACRRMDLSVPIWLDSNIEEFRRTSRTKFRKDSFIEETDFDYLEMQVTQEDWP